MMLLGRKTAAERVANFLLEMDRRLAAVGMVELPLSRRDIADYLGLTVETVSRTLSELNERGVLSFAGPRQFTLVNRGRRATMDMQPAPRPRSPVTQSTRVKRQAATSRDAV